MSNPYDDARAQPERDLTQKEKMFCLHFHQGLSARKAAVAAGYKNLFLPYQLLHHPSIQKEIKRLNDELAETIIVTHKQKLIELWEIVEHGKDREKIAAIAELNKMQDHRASQKIDIKSDGEKIESDATILRMIEMVECEKNEQSKKS